MHALGLSESRGWSRIETTIEALAGSAILVAFAEIGDKTQLLSFALAAQLRRPLPIIAGILVATLANHALAASVGVWLASLIAPATLRWIVGLAFIAFGAWALLPDEPPTAKAPNAASIFITALVAFFIAEMGDKTQLATVTLGARYAAPVVVTLGTTLGMLIANVPAVLLGERLAGRIRYRTVRLIAAGMFVATGLYTLIASG